MTTMEIRQRDFAADMRKYIDEGRAEGRAYNAAELAAYIVYKLKGEDRELLYGWLEAHAEPTIREAITRIDAASRAYARHTAPLSVFKEATDQAENGNPEPLRQGFLQAVYVINAENDRKALGDMTAEDVLYVSAGYDRRARSAKLEAEFLRQLAAKIGNGRVRDMFDNVELADLRNKITGV